MPCLPCAGEQSSTPATEQRRQGWTRPQPAARTFHLAIPSPGPNRLLLEDVGALVKGAARQSASWAPAANGQGTRRGPVDTQGLGFLSLSALGCPPRQRTSL